MRLSPHPTSLTLFPCGNLQGIHAPPLLLPLQTPKGGWVDLLLDQICTRAPLPNITSDELSTAKSKQPYLVLELLTCCQYLRFSWHFFFERVSSPSISATIFPSKSTLLITSLCTCSVPQLCQTGTPWTAAHQAPLPMGFSRQQWAAISSSRGSSQPRDWTSQPTVASGSHTAEFYALSVSPVPLMGMSSVFCLPKYFLPRVSLIM